MEPKTKRPREVEDEDNEPLIFMKQTRIRHILETSEDEEDLKEEIQNNLLP